MLELEYGITEQFVTELMFEWFEEIGNTQFTGVRLEARYRLFERADLGIGFEKHFRRGVVSIAARHQLVQEP